MLCVFCPLLLLAPALLLSRVKAGYEDVLNLAEGKATEIPSDPSGKPLLVDGAFGPFWTSDNSNPDWVQIDLGISTPVRAIWLWARDNFNVNVYVCN